VDECEDWRVFGELRPGIAAICRLPWSDWARRSGPSAKNDDLEERMWRYFSLHSAFHRGNEWEDCINGIFAECMKEAGAGQRKKGLQTQVVVALLRTRDKMIVQARNKSTELVGMRSCSHACKRSALATLESQCVNNKLYERIDHLNILVFFLPLFSNSACTYASIPHAAQKNTSCSHHSGCQYQPIEGCPMKA
jgi:hypothetical protein